MSTSSSNSSLLDAQTRIHVPGPPISSPDSPPYNCHHPAIPRCSPPLSTLPSHKQIPVYSCVPMTPGNTSSSCARSPSRPGCAVSAAKVPRLIYSPAGLVCSPSSSSSSSPRTPPLLAPSSTSAGITSGSPTAAATSACHSPPRTADRRPIDPPPIVQLRVLDRSTRREMSLGGGNNRDDPEPGGSRDSSPGAFILCVS